MQLFGQLLEERREQHGRQRKGRTQSLEGSSPKTDEHSRSLHRPFARCYPRPSVKAVDDWHSAEIGVASYLAAIAWLVLSTSALIAA